MQLRVFADEGGGFHLEISSPRLIYRRRLFLPMLLASTGILEEIDPETLIDVWYAGSLYRIPFFLVHSEEATVKNWKVVGAIEESDSRNVLNHVLDIMAWDSRLLRAQFYPDPRPLVFSLSALGRWPPALQSRRARRQR